jgi:hypothetical protein
LFSTWCLCKDWGWRLGRISRIVIQNECWKPLQTVELCPSSIRTYSEVNKHFNVRHTGSSMLLDKQEAYVVEKRSQAIWRRKMSPPWVNLRGISFDSLIILHSTFRRIQTGSKASFLWTHIPYVYDE